MAHRCTLQNRKYKYINNQIETDFMSIIIFKKLLKIKYYNEILVSEFNVMVLKDLK